LAVEYTPQGLETRALVTRDTLPGTGSATVLTWLPNADSLAHVTVGADVPSQTGTVVAQVLYVNPALATTRVATLLDVTAPTGPVSGFAEILAQGDLPVQITVTATDTGSVLVSASMLLIREGA